MDYAVIGGDMRFAYLVRLLQSCGYDARAVNGMPCDVPGVPAAEMNELPSAKAAVMNWPCADGEKALEKLPKGSKVYFCGPGEPTGIPTGLEVFDLWKDERLQLENAWLTAEGAICAAMNAGRAALKDCHCLVIGWGRIGKALTDMLVALNARVTVASRSENGRNSAAARGAECISTYRLSENLRGKQIIFSTPPQRVLDRDILKYADPDAMVIDLSSAPFGVDIEAAREFSLRAWREPRLPGRYCPFSAGKGILHAMLRAERKNEDE